MHFLTEWIGKRILNIDVENDGGTESALTSYRIENLNRILTDVQYKSRFYQEKFLGIDRAEIGVPADIESMEDAPELIQIGTLDDIASIPFTSADELEEWGYKMLCVKPEESARITTGKSKGRNGQVKNVGFSFQDQMEILEYVKNMLKDRVTRDDVALILLPCRRPGSIGDIYREALEHLGVHSVPYGPLDDERLDWSVYLDLLKLENVTTIIGEPVQVTNLSEMAKARSSDRRFAEDLQEINDRIKLVIFQHENFSKRSITSFLPSWKCSVIRNYGNLESGYRIAACTDTSEGNESPLYSVCDSDIYLEIVSPESGEVLSPGEQGEIVITTLTRTCMPLIRYRTGDKGMLIRGADERIYLSAK